MSEIDYIGRLTAKVEQMRASGLKDLRIVPNEETWNDLTKQERAQAILEFIEAVEQGKTRELIGECMSCGVMWAEGETHECKPERPEIAEARRRLAQHEQA